VTYNKAVEDLSQTLALGGIKVGHTSCDPPGSEVPVEKA
jgi:hypothetical protein